jgi:hypothetical protein
MVDDFSELYYNGEYHLLGCDAVTCLLACWFLLKVFLRP